MANDKNTYHITGCDIKGCGEPPELSLVLRGTSCNLSVCYVHIRKLSAFIDKLAETLCEAPQAQEQSSEEESEVQQNLPTDPESGSG